MASRHRTLLIVLGSIVALILLIALAIPLFISGDSFRAKIEQELSASLGRKVTIGKLDLSVLTGTLVATNASLAAWTKSAIMITAPATGARRIDSAPATHAIPATIRGVFK